MLTFDIQHVIIITGIEAEPRKGINMNANTIRLLHGTSHSTRRELANMTQYDTIWGDGSDPEVVKTWPIDQIAAARAELVKHACTYGELHDHTQAVSIDEWCIEICECDEDGDVIMSGDFEMAPGEWPYEVKRGCVYDKRGRQDD